MQCAVHVVFDSKTTWERNLNTSGKLVYLIGVSDEELLLAGGDGHGNHDGVTGIHYRVARLGPQGLCGCGTKQDMHNVAAR